MIMNTRIAFMEKLGRSEAASDRSVSAVWPLLVQDPVRRVAEGRQWPKGEAFPTLYTGFHTSPCTTWLFSTHLCKDAQAGGQERSWHREAYTQSCNGAERERESTLQCCYHVRR